MKIGLKYQLKINKSQLGTFKFKINIFMKYFKNS